MQHNRSLFDKLVAHMRSVEPTLRLGLMFGCPAVFVGRRLAFCVFGSAVVAKIPQAEAARLIAAGTAIAFRPYGRPAMKEWVEIKAKPTDVVSLVPVMSLALRHAKDGA